MLHSRTIIKKKREKLSITAQNERKCAKKHSLERTEMELSLFYFDGAKYAYTALGEGNVESTTDQLK